jgi:hypothetical protein
MLQLSCFSEPLLEGLGASSIGIMQGPSLRSRTHKPNSQTRSKLAGGLELEQAWTRLTRPYSRMPLSYRVPDAAC